MEVTERMKAVGRYSKIALTFPEAVRHLRREQMGDVSL